MESGALPTGVFSPGPYGLYTEEGHIVLPPVRRNTPFIAGPSPVPRDTFVRGQEGVVLEAAKSGGSEGGFAQGVLRFAVKTGVMVTGSVLGGLSGGPLGAVIGASLASGLVSWLDQAIYRERVDWGVVLIDLVTGLIPGGFGAMAARAAGGRMAAFLTNTAVKWAVLAGAADGAVSGFANGFAHGAYQTGKDEKGRFQWGRVRWDSAFADAKRGALGGMVTGGFVVGGFAVAYKGSAGGTAPVGAPTVAPSTGAVHLAHSPLPMPTRIPAPTPASGPAPTPASGPTPTPVFGPAPVPAPSPVPTGPAPQPAIPPVVPPRTPTLQSPIGGAHSSGPVHAPTPIVPPTSAGGVQRPVTTMGNGGGSGATAGGNRLSGVTPTPASVPAQASPQPPTPVQSPVPVQQPGHGQSSGTPLGRGNGISPTHSTPSSGNSASPGQAGGAPLSLPAGGAYTGITVVLPTPSAQGQGGPLAPVQGAALRRGGPTVPLEDPAHTVGPSASGGQPNVTQSLYPSPITRLLPRITQVLGNKTQNLAGSGNP